MRDQIGFRIFAIFIASLLLTTTLRSQMRQIYVAANADDHVAKMDFYSPSEGYVGFEGWIGFTIDSGKTYTRKNITFSNVNFNGYQVNLTFGFGISGIKAFNRDTVIVYGHYGYVPAILYSEDQCNTFKVVYHSTLNMTQLTDGITDMSFVPNSNTGFAVEADRIIRTTNKGQTWSTVLTNGNSFLDIVQTLNANYTFAVSRSTRRFYKTSTGGLFSLLPIPPDGQIISFNFLTPEKGWINMVSGSPSQSSIYYTSNGGYNWTKKNNSEAQEYFFSEMYFINDSTGYGLGGFDIYQTTDSGKIWQPLPRDNNYSYLNYGHNDLEFINNTQFWAGGGHGFIELTTNGGGQSLPTAYFRIDTTNLFSTGNVKLINYSKPGYSYKWIVNDVEVSTDYHTSYAHDIDRWQDSIKLVVSNGVFSDTLLKLHQFVVPPTPTIISFTPVMGSEGSQVTITGTNFTGTTSVSFGGVPASYFTVTSPTTIEAIVSTGASGNVTITTRYRTVSVPGFTFNLLPTNPPPSIITFTPASGKIGTTVTISGTNFDPDPSKNIIYFGATRATISSATSSSIVCTVPAGASFVPVSLLNTSNGLSCNSFKPFYVTFEDSSNFQTNSFRSAYKIELGTDKHLRYGRSADVDGDGLADLAITYVSGVDTIAVCRNTSTGTSISFGPRINISPYPGAISSGHFVFDDLDGDGKRDMALCTNSNIVNILRNTSVPGTISFEPLRQFVGGFGSVDIATEDFDRDGRPDIAIASYSSSSLTMFKNTSIPGSISFRSAVDFPSGGYPAAIATGDIDGDGKKDVVLENSINSSSNTSLSVFRNTSNIGNINFATKIDLAVEGTSLNCRSVHLADFDNDGKLDIITLTRAFYNIHINTSTPGNISFAPVQTISLNEDISGGSIDNLSGDSKPDVMLGGSSDRKTILYRNLSTPGNAVNEAPVSFPNYSYSYQTFSTDADNDGKSDIVVMENNSGIVEFFKNEIGLLNDISACTGSPFSITAEITGGTYQWQEKTGTGYVNLNNNADVTGTGTRTLTFSNITSSLNNHVYRCLIGNQVSKVYRLVVTTYTKPDVEISAASTNFCTNSPVTFTATAQNAGTVATYWWQINESTVSTTQGGTNTYTYYPHSNDRVRVIVVSNANCSVNAKDTSSILTMVSVGTMPTVSISGAPMVCAGAIATFTATATNGGTNPTYQWRVNSQNVGNNSPTFTTNTLQNQDRVTVVMTSNATPCGNIPVTSNSITMEVRPLKTPAVQISTNNSTCEGAPLTLTAYPTNPGTFALFQWKLNGVNVGTNDPNQYYTSSAFTNGTVVSVVLTSNEYCVTSPTATSAPVTISVTPVFTPSVSISGVTTINEGQSTTLTAVSTAYGSYSLQWQDSNYLHSWQNVTGVATTPTITYTPNINGTKVRCRLMSNNACATIGLVFSQPLTITINTVTTGIGPVSAASTGISFYPNPVVNTLTIDSLKISDKWEVIEISAINGAQVLLSKNIANQTRVTVNANSITSGMYVVVLRRKSGIPVFIKFIKL